jgi:predicted TIM-barrel fold metal-dependent hydrolase
VPVLVDVGTTGMGAGIPGGMGAPLEHARPHAVDNLAARFPALTIIAAHPGWPWTDEMTAVALHKGNVYWELSGWAPRYFPPSLRTDIRGRLREKIMFGSDHPSLPYERLLRGGTSSATSSPSWTWSSTLTPNGCSDSSLVPWPGWMTCGGSRCPCRARPST